MISNAILKLHKVFKAIENPILFNLRRKGGLPLTFEKLNTIWFNSLNIDTILDIGANTGQFTKTIACLAPDASIYAFEPLPDCFQQLESISSRNPNVKVFNLGIGAASGKLSFERNEYSDSSSFLKMADTHKQAFPFARNTTSVEVDISGLDEIAESLDLGKSLFIKIDVQGYEDQVLKGGRETIKKAKLIVVETSFVTLYEGQPLFNDIYKAFSELGFSYRGMLDQLSDPNTGEILQGDAIFVK